MTPIRELSQEVTEQIAAGEVVESPLSVVKELVENSLDAGATKVEVRIENGGLDEVRVFDNGYGLEKEEVPLAFRRHATSKLDSLETLIQDLHTLGFRGEALPSIATVSRVIFTSRKPAKLVGSIFHIEAGEIISHEETGCPPGTEVIVRDLFFNTPARKKFAQSRSREASRIAQLITGIAFSHPEVSFTLYHGKKTIFKSSGDGNLQNLIIEAYSREVAQSMVTVSTARSASEGELSLKGMISAPYLTRSSRRYQTMLVNRRLVYSPLLSQALERAYYGLLKKGRFPVAVLYLQVPPAFVDVNIHPAKSEVRFQNPKEVNQLVFYGAKESLQRCSTAYYFQEENRSSPSYYTFKGSSNLSENSPSFSSPNFPMEARSMDKTTNYGTSSLQNSTGEKDKAEKEVQQKITDSSLELVTRVDRNIVPSEKGAFQIIGQYLASYLVAEKNGDLVLIDQHAAHERVIYEKLRQEHSLHSISRVQLAVPLTLELPSSWADNFSTLLPWLEEGGFHLELFGRNTYVVREIPAFLMEFFEEQFFWDLLEEMLFSERYDHEELMDLFKAFACKSAVKAHQKLSLEEMEELINKWQLTSNSGYCPHGRPVAVTFGKEQLQRGFQRRGGGSNNEGKPRSKKE